MKKIFLTFIIMGFTATMLWAKDIYYCPMHTYYTSDKPGNCPICGMTLVKRKFVQTQNSASHPSGNHLSDYAPVTIDTRQMQLMGIKTAPVVKQPLVKTIRTVGFISTNHDLYQLQDEYIRAYIDLALAFRDARRFEHTRRSWESHREQRLKLHEAQDKLLRLGLGTHQIEQLQKVSWQTPWDQPQLLFFKEGTYYWVVAQIFEGDLGFVEPDQEAEIEIPVYAEKTKGIIRTIGGILDPQTRTVNALIELNQYRGELVGNMLVNVKVHVELNEYLMVPAEAVMNTGLRKIVFMQEKPGVFQPREVQVQALGDNGWAIKSGLAEKEQVAVSGNFLLDSESRLQAQSRGGAHD